MDPSPEGFGSKGLMIAHTVNDDRHQEGLLLGLVIGAFDCEVPLVPKITLELLLIPRISAAQRWLSQGRTTPDRSPEVFSLPPWATA